MSDSATSGYGREFLIGVSMCIAGFILLGIQLVVWYRS